MERPAIFPAAEQPRQRPSKPPPPSRADSGRRSDTQQAQAQSDLMFPAVKLERPELGGHAERPPASHQVPPPLSSAGLPGGGSETLPRAGEQ